MLDTLTTETAPGEEECRDACAVHRPWCDGYCDHGEDHRNACNLGTRVLHLGMIVRDVTALPDVPPLPPTYAACYGGGEAYLGTDGDSFRVWGNTEDPDEDHTEDGTRHIAVTVEADEFGTWTEDELGRFLHQCLRHYLNDLPSGWRAADYVVWSDDAWSENQNLIACP